MSVKQAKEIKTYSLNSLIIIIFLLLIVSIVLILVRSIKADEVVTKIKAVEKTIASLNKELAILKAEEAKYGAPNRFLEIGISSGTISPRGEDDIIYLKLQSQYEANIVENAKETVILEENIFEQSKAKDSVKKKIVKKENIANDNLIRDDLKNIEKKEITSFENNIDIKNNEENINSYEVETTLNVKVENVITE